MILLDTHIWIWWVQGDHRLTAAHQAHLIANETTGLGISPISCWEVAMLIKKGKLQFPILVEDWVTKALAYPGIVPLPLTAEIAVASVNLPDPFHADPADRIIVATARGNNWPLLTADKRILVYPHVTCLT